MSNIVSIGRDTAEAKLFDTKGGVVKLYTSLTVDQQTELLTKYGEMEDLASKTTMSLETVVACFISWNVGEDGKAMPCTADTLKKFTQRDLLAMLQVCTGRRMLDDKGNLLSAEEIGKKAVSA